mgnify:CR=1 FL=1
MYKAIGYFSTGFDIINIPNTPALLRSSAGKIVEYPVFDILQTRFLSSIKIKLTSANQYTNSEWALEGLDYIELVEDGSTTNQKSVFYYVSGYRLTSKDVAVLNIVQDSLLTAGVVTNSTISGNIFYKRRTVSKYFDTFGTWDLDDELLCPMEPLQLVHSGTTVHDDAEGKVSHCGNAGLFFIFTHSNGRSDAQYRSYEHTLIQSAVGLTSNGSSLLSMSNLDSYLEGKTYVSNPENQQGYTAIEHSKYPHPYNPRQVDLYLPTMVKHKANLEDVEYRYNHNPAYVEIHYGGMEYEDLKRSHDVQEALNVIRALGMESAILACYSLPEGAGELTSLGGANTSQVLTGKRYIVSTNGWYTSGNITGEKSDADSIQNYGGDTYNYDYLVNSVYNDGPVHNMRILYGKFRKYVMCSPSTGSAIEALPEELTALRWSYNSEKIGKHGSPYICCFTDPRPTGRPYYNFLKFGQSALNGTLDLYQGAIAGGQWSEVPITFTGMAGEFQARVGYNLDASYRDYLASPERTYRSLVSGAQMQMYNAQDEAWNNIGGKIATNATLAAGGGLVAGGPGGAVVGAVGGTVSATFNAMNAEASAANSYNNKLQNANYDMLRGATGNYNEAMQGNITANNLVERSRAREYERSKFELSAEYSVPRANFMATDTMRDITENCLFYARYTPTVKDLKRMDQILDAYGYKVNSFDTGNFGQRSRYTYMEGNIEYNGTVANIVGGKDMLADINAQLANGVRVWRVKPDGVLNPGD